MTKPFMDYLPTVLKNVLEFQLLMESEQLVFHKFHAALEETLNNQLFGEAAEAGVTRYESILGITPKDTETLEERRFRVKARFNEQLPFTVRVLENQLQNLCGKENVTVVMDHTKQTVTVRVALTSKSMIESVEKMLHRMIPCNIVIDLSLLYNTHEMLAAYTHAQLASKTHEQLRSEVL